MRTKPCRPIPLALIGASCGGPAAGDSPANIVEVKAFRIGELGTFVLPGPLPAARRRPLITEKSGQLSWTPQAT
jgi:hypothetical protein